MLKIPFLRNIFVVAFLFAIIFPVYDLFFIIPSYQALLVQETEREAARFVRFMTVSNHLEEIQLRADNIPESLIEDIHQIKKERILIKLRVFSSSGQIVFSTDSHELGTINKKDYFREVVTKGKIYSKMVRKESITAEGITAKIDLVETYVPMMVDGHFHGAMEVYYDITSGQQGLSSLYQQSLSILVSASSGLLLMTLLVLFRARNSIVARRQAEIALQKSNEYLEDRVAQRTKELSTTNQLLAAEISERKKAQQAQKQAFIATLEARDRIDAIISSVADALLVTDHQDCILLINPAAETLFNVKSTDVLGRRLPDVIGYDELLLQIAKSRTLLSNAESVDFDFEMSHEKTKRVYQGRASRLRETSVNGRGLILLIHDVTRERQIDRMKSEFVSMAAHELQTPLTMVLGYSELLLDQTKQFEPSEKAGFLQIINNKSIELSGLIDDILDLSRIEDGRGLKLDFTYFDAAALFRRIVSSFEGTNSSHHFVLDLAAEHIFVNADESRLTQVIENLVGNAVKYSPDGGTIRLSLDQEENWVRFGIIDQGIGMSSEEQANAFERFYRADSSNTAVRGTGLGLSISKYIIDAHGGKIDLFSSRGKGTRLEIRLPQVH